MVKYHSNCKERQCQRMFKLPHRCTHLSHQQSNAQNSPNYASAVCDLRTSRCSSWIWKRQRTGDQIVDIHWIIEKAREFQKNIYFCFIDYVKAFVWITTNWKVFQEMGIPDHLTCLLRNMQAGSRSNSQNQTWNNGLVPNWERNTPRLYIVTLLVIRVNFTEYIMQNARLDEAQAGIKIAEEIPITSDTQMTPPLWQKVTRN